MAAERGLGKGIDAMISGDDTKMKKVVKEVIKEVDTIDINKIEPNNNKPRKNFNEDKININAPLTAIKALESGVVSVIFFI